MAGHVEDLWVRKDRTRKPRYGHGKRWRAHWVEPNGDRATATFKTKDAAQAHLTRMDHQVRAGEYVTAEVRRTTVGAYWPRLRALKEGKAPKTWGTYVTAWDNHVAPRWEHTPVNAVTTAAVQDWLNELTTRTGAPLSASGRLKARTTLRLILDMATTDRAIPANPVTGTDVTAPPPKPRRYLTRPQVVALTAAFRPHHLEIWMLVLTGIRKGELWGIRGEDVDPVRGRVRIARDLDAEGREDHTKSRRTRWVPVPAVLLPDLVKAAARSGPAGYVFPGPSGTRWTSTMWRRRWDKARAATWYPDFDTHELRHTAASWAIASGADVKLVQRMLGHASAAMTLDTYAELMEDRMGDVADRMGAMLTGSPNTRGTHSQ